MGEAASGATLRSQLGQTARRIATLGLPVLLVGFLANTLMPVYSDEIGWRLQHRAAVDGGFDIAYNDICGPNSIARPPAFMMPVRWFSAWTNGLLDTPMLVRATGVACAMAAALLLVLLIRRLAEDGERRRNLAAIGYGLLGLGVLPQLLVLSRPEQPLLLGLLVSLIVALSPLPAGQAQAIAAAWRRSAGIVLITMVTLSYHPKAVPFAGITLACLLVCARGRATLLPRLAGIAVVVGLTGLAALYWTGRFSCPGDAVLADRLGGENVAALLARGGSLGTVTAQMLERVVPLDYIRLVVPPNAALSNWLPVGQFKPLPQGIFRGAIQLVWRAALLLAALNALSFVWARRWQALCDPRLLMALALFGCAGIWSASQIHQPPYDAALMMPLLMLGILLCFALPEPAWPVRTHATAILGWILVPLALISQVWVIGSLMRAFTVAAQTPGYVGGQPFSVSVAGYTPVRRDIDRAMAAAGFPQGRRLRHLLIDDVTYLHLQDSYQPFHRLGVLQTWTGRINDPLAYLRSRGSDGLVVGCHYLEPEQRTLAARSGRVCAIALAPRPTSAPTPTPAPAGSPQP